MKAAVSISAHWMQPLSSGSASVITATWSRHGGDECIRVRGAAQGSVVEVRPDGIRRATGLPAMAGRVVVGEDPVGGSHPSAGTDDAFFVPRFPFVAGTAYAVWVDGSVVSVLLKPDVSHTSEAKVLEIHPTVARVPVNLLRFTVQFSAPMTEGRASRHMRLVDDAGQDLPGALFATDYELWNRERTRLTVLLDPGRIKRGLVGHQEHGYPLRTGESFRIAIDSGFLDARGASLASDAERSYRVDGEERRRVRPELWQLSEPQIGTRDPLTLVFEKPLDHSLLLDCIRVRASHGGWVEGELEVGAEQESLRVAPSTAWQEGLHQVVVAAELEDLAGNSVRRVFDRDLARPDDEPGPDGTVMLNFIPRRSAT